MNVLDLVRAKGIEPKKVAATNGGEYASPCPGCGGEDRFRIWPAQKNGDGSWWCRGCDKGGDGIQFLIEFDGKTFPEACDALNKPLPEIERFRSLSSRSDRTTGWRPVQIKSPDGVDVKLWREKAEKFVEWAHGHLLEDEKKLASLADRGIRIGTIKRFRLGYNPGAGRSKAIFRPREAWGLPIEQKTNGQKKKLWIPRGIVIPYIHGNEVLRIRIRRSSNDLSEKYNARYYVVPGSTMAPMFINADRNAFVIVETELDACLVHQEAGDLAGVLALGSAAAKPDVSAAEAIKDADCILNALDFDRAGAQAWTWWENTLQRIRTLAGTRG